MQKIRAKEEKAESGKEDEKRGKGRNNGHSNLFFISPRTGFFICAVVIFGSKMKTLSGVSKLNSLLFTSKTSMVGQLGDLQWLNIHPYPILATFFPKFPAVLRI